MRHNKNNVFVKRFFPKTPDNVAIALPVDQFPVKDFNRNIFGWPKSDITILDELSKSQVYDQSKYVAFASRLKVLMKERGERLDVEKDKDKIDSMIRQHHPSWMQTISEERDFSTWFYENFDTTLGDSDNPNPDNHEETSDSADDSSDN